MMMAGKKSRCFGRRRLALAGAVEVHIGSTAARMERLNLKVVLLGEGASQCLRAAQELGSNSAVARRAHSAG